MASTNPSGPPSSASSPRALSVGGATRIASFGVVLVELWLVDIGADGSSSGGGGETSEAEHGQPFTSAATWEQRSSDSPSTATNNPAAPISPADVAEKEEDDEASEYEYESLPLLLPPLDEPVSLYE